MEHQCSDQPNFIESQAVGSFLAVDLGPTRLLRPARYCLRCLPHDENAPRHWQLQGSVDENTWCVLRSHVDDPSLKETSEASWVIVSDARFRHFRILQTGENSGNKHKHRLSLIGIELYGELFS